MAKVIKRGGNVPAPAPQPAKKTPQKRSGKVIDREVYNAQQRAQQIILKGENEKQHREEQGHLTAQKTYEESFSKAAAQAEQELAFSLISAFEQRRLLIETAMEDVQTLAMEIVYKIVGTSISLSENKQNEILSIIQKRFLNQRHLQIGLAATLKAQLEKEMLGFHEFISSTPEIQFQVDTALNDEQAWVRCENQQFRAESHALLNHLAACYHQAIPSFKPILEPVPVLQTPSEVPPERTVAISLEELKQQAEAAKRLKNKD